MNPAFLRMWRIKIIPLISWRLTLRRFPAVVIGTLISLTVYPLAAEPLTRELGENLHYVRAHILPQDLPSPGVKDGALILDLRFTLAEAGGAAALKTLLESPSRGTTPTIVLVNADTAPALLETLVRGHTQSGLITIGRASSELVPDLSIQSTDDEESRAYEALKNNASIESLISENSDKPRIDEASIMRARENSDGEETDLDFPARATELDKNTSKEPPAFVDRALQRAVHLHRALLALKRL